jgi:serine/threonine protein kinase
MVRHAETGKYRRTCLLVLTPGYSRKPVRLLTFKSLLGAFLWALAAERPVTRSGRHRRLGVSRSAGSWYTHRSRFSEGVMVSVGGGITVGPTRWRVAEEIGHGGFGVVYRLVQEDPPGGEDLALKVLLPAAALDDIWKKKFDREARILANVQHPNVVKIKHTWRFNDGRLGIVQELVAGAKKLRDYMRSPDARPLSVILQVLYGLRAVHAAQESAVHRDISPNNILVDENHVVRIIDFGLAKEKQRKTEVLTKAGEYFGTPGCIAPEQEEEGAADVDHRADIFAVGRTITAGLQDRAPTHANPNELDEPWRSICVELTRYDREQRPQTVEEAIQRVLRDFMLDGALPEDAEIHFREFRNWPVPPHEWCLVARLHFTERKGPLTAKDLRLAEMVPDSVLSNPSFDVNSVFARLDAEAIEDEFGAGDADFEKCDPLGDLLFAWYPRLDTARRTQCFERLVKTAVQYHRYSLMERVRGVFRLEASSPMIGTLTSVLEREDPGKVIHGWGSIPAR